jgi:hypothetical protein
MPGGSSAGFERDTGAKSAPGVLWIEQRIDADRTGKVFGWAFA